MTDADSLPSLKIMAATAAAAAATVVYPDEVVTPIIDGLLQDISKHTSEEECKEQEKVTDTTAVETEERLSVDTMSREADEDTCESKVGASFEEETLNDSCTATDEENNCTSVKENCTSVESSQVVQDERVATQNSTAINVDTHAMESSVCVSSTNEKDSPMPADVIVPPDNESDTKDSFMNKIGLETKNGSQNTPVELDNNTVMEKQKKDSVHFGSPIASYHEYYVSQDTCTQTLSEIDASESPCNVASLNDDIETSDESRTVLVENVPSDHPIIMTPAGDCTNSKVNCLINNVVEAGLVQELQCNIIKTASDKLSQDDVGSKNDKFVLINPFIEDTSDKLIPEDLATNDEKSSLVSVNSELPGTNSSPDLFDDNGSDCDESEDAIPGSQTMSDKGSLDEDTVTDSSFKDDVTASIRTEDITTQTAEIAIPDNQDNVEADCVEKQTREDLTSDTRNSDREPVSSETFNAQEANAETNNETCGSIARCGTTECDGSQDLFLDTNNREGDRDADTQILDECRDEPLQQQQPSPDTCSLYCDESLDTSDDSACVDSQPNKRSLLNPDSPTPPSKKPKLDDDGQNNSQEVRALKRTLPSSENNEELSLPKKSNLSLDKKEDKSVAFFPKSLKSLASENLECMPEEILWRKEVDPESQSSVPIVNEELLLASNELSAAVQCVENNNLGSQTEQIDNLQENAETNIKTESVSEIILKSEDTCVETNKVDEQVNNNELPGTPLTSSETTKTEEDLKPSENSVLENSNGQEEEIRAINKPTDNEEVSCVPLQPDQSLNAEDIKSEDQPNEFGAIFISATEYLSQSSQGSSTGFAYDKNVSPQYTCESQEFLSLPVDVPVHPTEDEQDVDTCCDNPGSTEASVVCQSFKGTVELASEDGQSGEIHFDTPRSTQASVVCQSFKGTVELASEDGQSGEIHVDTPRSTQASVVCRSARGAVVSAEGLHGDETCLDISKLASKTVELTAEGGLCRDTCHEDTGATDVSGVDQPGEVAEIAAEPDNIVDTETLDMMVLQAIDHIVPDEEEIAAEQHAETPDDCSMFDKTEEKDNKFYSCDLDLCDEEDRPMCSPVDKKSVPTDLSVPSSSSGVFKWRSAPSCDADTDRPITEVDMEDAIVKITPIHTCNKPLRLGLSKKRQPLHRLHKF